MFQKFTPSLNLDRVSQIAEFLEKEIIERGFRPGDAFPSALDLAARFEMSKSSANRVLMQLADRGIIVRHRGRGNFIGGGTERAEIAPRSIYIVEAADRVALTPEIVGRVSGWLILNQPLGVQSILLPLESPLRTLRATLGGAVERGEVECVLAISCPREVYDYLLEIHVPTAVIGSLYGDQNLLSSIDRDARKEGFLLAQYLIGRRHRKIGVFQPHAVRPGTQAFLDGVQDAVGRARGVSLRFRPLPPVEAHMKAVLSDLLMGDDRPDSIITEGTNLALIAAELAKKNDILVPSQLEIVHSTSTIFPSEPSRFPHTHPVINDGEFFSMVYQMLLNSSHINRNVIDVRLTVPDEARAVNISG